jgi:hypothetical protein
VPSGAAAFRFLESLPLYLLAPLKEWIARSPSSIMFLPLRGESTLSTECSNLAGVANGDRRHNGKLAEDAQKALWPELFLSKSEPNFVIGGWRLF